jgi:hypothetical protein
MNEITTVGVDLAKEVIAVCAADRSGKSVFTRIFRREAFAAWAVQLPPCTNRGTSAHPSLQVS